MSRPPFRVTLLLCVVLILTVWNALRLWTALAWQVMLSEYSSQPTAATLAVSGAFWMMIGVILTWSIWQGKPWAAKLLLGASAGYTVWYWSERLIWQNPHPNWPFAVIVNLTLLVLVLFANKSLTREAHERKLTDSKID